MPGAPRRQVIAAALLLALLVAAVFGQTLTFGFVAIDDDHYVARNPPVAGGLTLAGARWALTSFHASNWHPLTWLSHMLDVTLFGLAPGGHHLTSVLLHAAAAVLLFLALRAMTGALAASAFTAGLFATHPLRVESVAWVAERKDVLSGFFWMLTLLLYARYARRPAAGRGLAVAAAFALGLAAKSALVTLPAVLLLLDWWPLGRLRAARGEARLPAARLGRLLLEKLPLAALAAGAALLTWRAQAAAGAIDPAPLAPRLANAAVSYARYLGATLWPSGLAVFYPLRREGWPAATVAAAVALLLLLTAGAFLRARREPWLAVGWLWFAVALLPMAGLVQVGGQAMADRYTYLPLAGLFAAAAWSAAAFAARRPRARLPVAAAGTALVALLGVAAGLQARLWGDDLLLFGHAARVAPGNWVAHSSLGVALAGRGDREGAEREYRAAIAANPAYFGGHANYAYLLYRSGRLPEARAHAVTALAISPAAAAAYGVPALIDVIENPALAAAYLVAGEEQERLGNRDGAIAWYELAARVHPGDPAARSRLAAAREAAARRGTR